MARLPTVGLVALLLVSLTVNARLLLAPHAGVAAPPVKRSEAPPVPPSPSPVALARAAECERRLEACEAGAWDLARKAIGAGRAPRLAARADGGARDSAPRDQASILCGEAERTLRETWRRDRDKMAADLVKSLGDRAEQERDLDDELAKMREATGIGEGEASLLEAAYRERRFARVAEGEAALQQDPANFDALLAALRGLYADEDAMLERISGTQARDAWRSSQLEGRTVLLALFAAMADKDWEGSIQW